MQFRRFLGYGNPLTLFKKSKADGVNSCIMYTGSSGLIAGGAYGVASGNPELGGMALSFGILTTPLVYAWNRTSIQHHEYQEEIAAEMELLARNVNLPSSEEAP